VVTGLLLAAGAVVALWNFEIPYVTYSAGPVKDVLEEVTVDGAQSFPPSGDLLMLTVSGQRINVFEAIVAGLDPGVDVIAESRVRRPGESDEQANQRNRDAMDLSKETAIGVALRQLGYEIDLSGDGVRVVEIEPGTPAADVLNADDLITAVDGSTVFMPEEIGSVLAGKHAGDVVDLAVTRQDQDLDLQVELVSHSEDPDRVMIGIIGETSNLHFGTLPFDIEIDSGQVGGPSAGLMYALGVIDMLTPGELTKGHVIAGTGTIDPDGNVGAIGGVRQKMVGAAAAGAEYAFVPADNIEAAETAPVNGLTLVPVSNLQDALNFLNGLQAA
jgi:PDZ domain-containing protein